jgi:5-methyltetrahydrofolate--homocysteine methyltransferase
MRELFPFINETALFKNQWRLKTAPQEDYLRRVEEKFRPIEKKMEEEIIASGVLEPKVVFPAHSEGNDTIVYDPENEASAKGASFRAATSFRRSHPGRWTSSACRWSPLAPRHR